MKAIDHTKAYTDTFITVAEDSQAKHSEVPVVKNGKKTQHLLQYELLSENPYRYDHEHLTYEVFVRSKGFSKEVLKKDGQQIKSDLFCKGHPCMRASALTKRHGFGVHYDKNGKIAIYPVESKEYKTLVDDITVKKIPAMKTKR